MRNPLGRINYASSPGPVVLWVEELIGELLNECFRLRQGPGRNCCRPRKTQNRQQKKNRRVWRGQKEPSGPIQLNHGRLKEAFAPGAANGQALVKRLPADPN